MKNKRVFFSVILLLLISFTLLQTLFLVTTNTSSSNGLIKSFSKNIPLSTSDTKYPQHVEPTLAIGQNNELYVGWKDALQPSSAGVDVSFTKSPANGTNWTIPVSMPSDISSGGGSKSDAWMNVYNNTIYYSYLEYNNSDSAKTFSQVTMAKSSDGGINWSVSKASENKNFADKETFIISKNGTIFLTYDDVNLYTGLGNVKLSKSINGGKNFTDISTVNQYTPENILAPYPALSSNQTLFVAWLYINITDNFTGDVYYAYSNNGGLNFSNQHDLNPETNYGVSIGSNNAPGKSTIPVMRFDSNNRLYILWAEYNNNWKVYLRYSDNFGKDWSPKIPINDVNNVNQWEPDMAIDSQNNVHVIWYQESNGQYRPYYREISFSGVNRTTLSMSAVIPVASAYTSSSFTRPGDYCTIRVDSNGVPQVVWTDGRTGSLNIYYAHETSNLPVSSSPGFVYPVVVITFFIILVTKKKSHH